MTLTLNIIMGGALTGAAFNPARALGPMVVTGNFTDVWLYMAAPIVGSIVAAILHTGLVRLAHERSAATAVTSIPAELSQKLSTLKTKHLVRPTGGARRKW